MFSVTERTNHAPISSKGFENRGIKLSLVVPFQHRNFTQRCTIIKPWTNIEIYINRVPAGFNHDIDFIDKPCILSTSISDDDSLFLGQKIRIIRTKPAL